MAKCRKVYEDAKDRYDLSTVFAADVFFFQLEFVPLIITKLSRHQQRLAHSAFLISNKIPMDDFLE